MNAHITIIGGTYLERCVDPDYLELYGSGLRGAAALSSKGCDISLHSCVGKNDLGSVQSICAAFQIKGDFKEIDETVKFNYYHPLSVPEVEFLPRDKFTFSDLIQSEIILYYGFIEANATVKGEFVVYDPQNHESFKSTGSTANHLALILNQKEASILSGFTNSDDLEQMGRIILQKENAEVVVIKNGAKGALLIEPTQTTYIPIFKVSSVWPIGSGDVFSAIFAWHWAVLKSTPEKAALSASNYTASYCESRVLPAEINSNLIANSVPGKNNKKIYLAGPFFTMSQRWLVNELFHSLLEFGNSVFSPFHHVGVVDISSIQTSSLVIAEKDLSALREAEIILAVVDTCDAGTLFEIGYARALNKPVVIFSQNISENDLVMLYGTDCMIVNDFSTAIYSASW